MILSFPATRLRISFTAQSSIGLPKYAGSTLRGGFLRALRAVCCITRAPECPPCALYRACPYPAITAPPPKDDSATSKADDPAPAFVIEPPSNGPHRFGPGDAGEFRMVLFGRARAQLLPYVILAWQRALEHGIGRGDGVGKVCRVTAEGVSADTEVLGVSGELTDPAVQGVLVPTLPTSNRLTLDVLTPLRLIDMNGKRPLRVDEISGDLLLRQLFRRIHRLADLYSDEPVTADFRGLAKAAATIRCTAHLRPFPWKRKSSRQKKVHPMDGLEGTAILEGELAPFLPYLYLGQWTHVGKGASMGLGQFRVREWQPVATDVVAPEGYFGRASITAKGS